MNASHLPSIHDKPAKVAPEPTTDLVYTFKISRRCAPAEFKNLWQLIVKTPTDNQPVEVVDADSLSTVIGKIQYIFEADGL